jgi:hypothetical protein
MPVFVFFTPQDPDFGSQGVKSTPVAARKLDLVLEFPLGFELPGGYPGEMTKNHEFSSISLEFGFKSIY